MAIGVVAFRRGWRLLGPLGLAVVSVTVGLVGPGSMAEAQTPGLVTRPSNPTCIAPPRPSDPNSIAIKVERTLGGINFPSVVFATQHPALPGVWYLVEKSQITNSHPARIQRVGVDPDGTVTSVSTFLDLTDRVFSGWEAGLKSMAFHPDFPNTPEFFVTYESADLSRPPFDPGPPPRYFSITHVSRFTSPDGGLTGDPNSEEVMISVPLPNVAHFGGGMAFGPDGYLYHTIGDGADLDYDNAQDTSNLLGSMIRIDVDGGSPYSIPPDNPFAAGGGAPELYAWGLRNPWAWNFDSLTGDLWVGDVGGSRWEEINRLEKGKNYGWRVMEGSFCYLLRPCNPAPYEPPFLPLLHVDQGGDFGAVTGGTVYRGSAIPELYGVYVFADFMGGVYGLFYDELGNPYERLLTTSTLNVLSFAEGLDKELYIAGGNFFHKIVPDPNQPSSPFPTTLVETGCYEAGDPTQVVSGAIPYSINSPLWSDAADKTRFMALPDGQTIEVLPDGDFEFPVGTVLIKHFEVDGKLVETRHLVRHDDGGWAGYGYEWNEDHTEATYVPGGSTFPVGSQTWTIPSTVQCLRCHTNVAGSTLGPSIGQFNRDHTYSATGITASQLDTLEHVGMFTQPLPTPESRELMPELLAPGEPLNARVRAYLHSNCSHCHQPDGPTQAAIDLRFSTSDAGMGICNVPPALGDLGIPNALVLAPNDPNRSILAERLGLPSDNEGMPPLLKALIDTTATAEVHSWINTWIEDQGVCLGPDSDGDTVVDAGDNCAAVSNLDQTNSDSDSDGDACDADDDDDELPDTLEAMMGTSSISADTDGDGLSDAWEHCFGEELLPSDPEVDPATDCIYDPYHPTTNPTGTDLSATLSDTDGDGVGDSIEVNGGSDPLNGLQGVPTMGTWGLLALSALFAFIGYSRVRRAA